MSSHCIEANQQVKCLFQQSGYSSLKLWHLSLSLHPVAHHNTQSKISIMWWNHNRRIHQFRFIDQKFGVGHDQDICKKKNVHIRHHKLQVNEWMKQRRMKVWQITWPNMFPTGASASVQTASQSRRIFTCSLIEKIITPTGFYQLKFSCSS